MTQGALNFREQSGIGAIHPASDQEVSQEVVFALLQQSLGDFKCYSAGAPQLSGEIAHEHEEPMFGFKSSLRGECSQSLFCLCVVGPIDGRWGYRLGFGV